MCKTFWFVCSFILSNGTMLIVSLQAWIHFDRKVERCDSKRQKKLIPNKRWTKMIMHYSIDLHITPIIHIISVFFTYTQCMHSITSRVRSFHGVSLHVNIDVMEMVRYWCISLIRHLWYAKRQNSCINGKWVIWEWQVRRRLHTYHKMHSFSNAMWCYFYAF